MAFQKELEVHPQVELVKELVKSIFKYQHFSCAILVCKNPKLISLLCCEFAKTELSSPYPAGTNLYYPIDGTNKYSRVKIQETTEIGGDIWYKFASRRGNNPICEQFNRLDDFNNKAKLARDQEDADWIDRNNVSADSIQTHSGTFFPTIISQFRGFEEVFHEEIEGSTLNKLLGINCLVDLKCAIRFTSENKVDLEHDKNRVWINTVPERIDNNNIVLLSTAHSRFVEFKSEVESLFIRTESAEAVQFDELPQDLKSIVEITSGTNPLSIWRVR
ncbi:hypothetical protein R6Y90_15445 [Alteromonas macleodii]|uniref:hypothetical protein n=1 Tax=Alteromonas macleodii TaxID=28108 RepID=UPI0029825846|nr:hypothetical protein [Alteromonas macleodii]MDW5286358.1 hypothetical protein [Alteromonas macleodii]